MPDYRRNRKHALRGRNHQIGTGTSAKARHAFYGVEDVLLQLQGKYKLVLATKGDLFDQRRKVMSSGLMKYFCHVEIMSDKKETDYQKLLDTMKCNPRNFLMLGNSVKSDILPVLELGGYAAHIPYHITWQYETHDGNITSPNFIQLKNIKDITEYLL